MRTGLRMLAASVLVASVAAGCGDSGSPAPSGAPVAPVAAGTGVSQPATIEALAVEFQAAQKANDAARLEALGRSIAPTTDDLKAVLRAGPDTDAFLAAYKGKDIASDPKGAVALGRTLFAPGKPERTETRAYSATTEELVAYAQGTPAFDEFPGGMRRFAEKVAAPGRTWWVVEHVEPGSDTGMKYTCFTRLGDRWLFVAKPWDAVPRDAEDGK